MEATCTCGGNGICINCALTQFSEPIETCAICDECIFSEPAEMYEPGGEAQIVHASCGQLKGWEVA